MPSVLPRTSFEPVATLRHWPWCISRVRSPSWRASATISEIISSATLRVLENGALNTGTPRLLAESRSTWLVPMQNAPMSVSRRRAASSAGPCTWVLLRMPSTWTSATRAASSSPSSACLSASTWNPSASNSSMALLWTPSSNSTLIWSLGNEVVRMARAS